MHRATESLAGKGNGLKKRELKGSWKENCPEHCAPRETTELVANYKN
jgi:hypothetical protein